MANANTAAETLRTWAARYQDILELAALLDGIGSLDGAAKEAEGRRDVAEAAEREAQDDLQRTTALLDTVRAQCERLTAEAQDAAARLVADADVRAKCMLNEGRAAADQLRNDAQADITRAWAASSTRVAEAQQQQHDAETMRDAALAEKAAAERERADLNTSIAAARASVRRLLG